MRWKFGARNVTSRVTLVASLGILLLFSAPKFANFLVWHMENSRQNPEYCKQGANAHPIVVLGGGTRNTVGAVNAYDILTPASLRRVMGALDIARIDSQFYLLGGGFEKYKEADQMAKVLVSMGVSEEKITVDRLSTSTMGNARALTALLHPNNGLNSQGTRITLVTSALHVARASKIFEQQGFEVCHYATDTRYQDTSFPVNLMPFTGALHKSSETFREYIGTAYFELKTLAEELTH